MGHSVRGWGDVDGEMSTTHIFMFACCVFVCCSPLFFFHVGMRPMWRWGVVTHCPCVCVRLEDTRMGMWMWGKLLVLLDQHTHTHVPLLLSIYLHVVLCCGDVCVHRCVACLMRVSMSTFLIQHLYGFGYLGRMGSCVGHNPKHTFTHPHTSSIHTHGSASMLHACRLCVGMCVWIEMWGSTHTQLRWNVRIWGMGCTLPHTQACLGCGVCVCSPFLISPLVFSSMYD